MKLRALCVICMVSVLLVLSGCHWDPYEDDYTRNPVNVADLPGTYVANAETLKDMAKGGYKISTHQIILRSDGTYTMQNMPDWYFNFGTSHDGFKSGAGHWQLRQFPPANGNRGEAADIRFDHPECYATLRGQGSPYKLHFRVGDADEGKAVVFEKLPQ